jgi:hypothetical protein
MAWDFVTEMHEPIRQVLLPYRGQEITIRQWDELIEMVPGIGSRAKFIHASDQQPEQHRWMQNMPRGWASTGKASQTWTTTRFLSCALNVNPTLVESAVFNTLATSLAFFPLEICLLA